MLFKKTRTVNGQKVKGQTWIARFRNHDGIVRDVNTKCRTKDGAERVLKELQAKAERVTAGVLTAGDLEVASWAKVPATRHLEDFLTHLRGKNYAAEHIASRQRFCALAIKACRLSALQDISRPKIEVWLKTLKESGASMRTAERGASARTVNIAKASVVQFVRWAIREGRMTSNPLEHLQGYCETVDRRHIRRALAPEELAGLIETARTRPLEEKKVNRGSEAGLSPDTVAKLAALGATRAMAYALMAGTGLRYGELRRLRLCDLVLDVNNPRVELPGQSTKNRKEAGIPLRSDLAAELARTSPCALKRLSGPHRKPSGLSNCASIPRACCSPACRTR